MRIILSIFSILFLTTGLCIAQNFPQKISTTYRPGRVASVQYSAKFRESIETLSNGLKVHLLDRSWPMLAIMDSYPENNKILVDTNGDRRIDDESFISPIDENQYIFEIEVPNSTDKWSYLVEIYTDQGITKATFASNFSLEGRINIKGSLTNFFLVDLNIDGETNKLDGQAGTNIKLFPDPESINGRWVKSNTIIEVQKNFLVVDSIGLSGEFIIFNQSPLPLAKIGDAAPDFSIPRLSGGIVKNTDFHGSWLLLDFWYTGCKPCIFMFPKLKKDLKPYLDRMEVLSICMDKEQQKEKAKSIIQQYQLSWSHAFIDPIHDIWTTYGSINQNNKIYPLYVLIDPKGIIRWAGNPRKYEELITELPKYLSE